MQVLWDFSLAHLSPHHLILYPEEPGRVQGSVFLPLSAAMSRGWGGEVGGGGVGTDLKSQTAAVAEIPYQVCSVFPLLRRLCLYP